MSDLSQPPLFLRVEESGEPLTHMRAIVHACRQHRAPERALHALRDALDTIAGDESGIQLVGTLIQLITEGGVLSGEQLATVVGATHGVFRTSSRAWPSGYEERCPWRSPTWR